MHIILFISTWNYLQKKNILKNQKGLNKYRKQEFLVHYVNILE